MPGHKKNQIATPDLSGLINMPVDAIIGITDLRYGNLPDADWHGKVRFAHGGDPRNTVPLPAGVACYTVAAATSKKMGDLSDSILADGRVPLASAPGQHEDGTHSLNFAPERQAVVYGTHHFAVLDSPEVAQKLLEWLVPANFFEIRIPS